MKRIDDDDDDDDDGDDGDDGHDQSWRWLIILIIMINGDNQ